jgi:hypothetical protein
MFSSWRSFMKGIPSSSEPPIFQILKEEYPKRKKNLTADFVVRVGHSDHFP